MLNTELTVEETEVLREVLRQHLKEMEIEIDRTDTHDYKVMLRHRRDLLRSVLNKLAKTEASVGAP
jgi:hypothetical protein